MDSLAVTASVVIPTTGRRPGALARLLDALSRQDVPHDSFEVIVVFDGLHSVDGAIKTTMSAERGLNLKSVFHEVNRGRAAACNSGIAATQGATILLLDDDMEPTSAWLRSHLKALEEHPTSGVIGGAPIDTETLRHPVGRYFAWRFDRHMAKLARLEEIGYRDVYTGNFSISCERLQQVGGFDEGFTAYGNEDGELAVRLIAAGTSFVFEPKALAIQHHDKDLKAAFADAQAKGRTALFLARKHPAAAGDLRLSQPGSPRRRAVRGALLRTARIAPFVSAASVEVVRLLERTRWGGLNRAYEWLFDYGYWLGVEAARRT